MMRRKSFQKFNYGGPMHKQKSIKTKECSGYEEVLCD